MLKLESGLLGKYVRQEMLSAVVFRLVELDVSLRNFPLFFCYVKGLVKCTTIKKYGTKHLLVNRSYFSSICSGGYRMGGTVAG